MNHQTKDASTGTVGFLVKVVVFSAVLSLLLKYGGPLLPIAAPYTERLNRLVTAVIVLPSLVLGTGLIFLLKDRPYKD